MGQRQIVIIGGGAAGVFAAITCAESGGNARAVVLEKTAQLLSKVRISGGGRCNVTNARTEARDLGQFYPRGGQALLGPLRAFGPSETMQWFEDRGVKLKVEPDKRVFPASDLSQTIVNCLEQAAQAAGVALRRNCGVERVSRRAGGGFEMALANGESMVGDRVMLATGGCRAVAAGNLAVALGHTIEPPVPSLFTLHLATPWLRELAGISVPEAEVSVPDMGLRETGALLVTHEGLSGPAILRLSAWGARALQRAQYQFRLRINWRPGSSEEALAADLQSRAAASPARLVAKTPLAPLAARLWEKLVAVAGVPKETRWAELSRAGRHRLVQQLARTELQVTGKSLNRDEFVTCGGVRLSEVDFKTMESRLCPGLHFGGELLDIDGLTGGFNFQAAWTTGWLAGRAMAKMG